MENVVLYNITASLKKIAILAGDLLTAKHDNLYIMEKSSSKDLVTAIDVEIQTFIIDKLKAKFSAARFITEESENKEEHLQSELVFIIDPIDGTANFVKGMNHSCICIGCFSCGVPIAGVVYDPYVKELFSAAKGDGAYLNERPIRVTEGSLQNNLVLFGTAPYDTDTIDDTLYKLKKVYLSCLDLRRMGSAALDICNVACGRAGLYFEARISLWDYAAAAVILVEAGGKLYDYKGNPISFALGKTSIIAGKQSIIKESNLIEEG